MEEALIKAHFTPYFGTFQMSAILSRHVEQYKLKRQKFKVAFGHMN